MSSPKQDLGIVKEFMNIYTYVSELGRQFNLFYERLESIELQLKAMSVSFNESLNLNKNEIIDIKEKMFTKTDFDEFIVDLQLKVEETLPSLPNQSL